MGLIHQANPFSPSPMKVLVWNYKGASNPNFCNNFLDIIHLHKPIIAIVLETRIPSDRANSNLGFDNVYYSDAIGFNGGIWVL